MRSLNAVLKVFIDCHAVCAVVPYGLYQMLAILYHGGVTLETRTNSPQTHIGQMHSNRTASFILGKNMGQ